MLYQVVSVVGALLILLAYGLNQRGRLTPQQVSYSLMNLIGSSLLLWVAIVDRRAGFVLIEAAWAAMSLIPLLRRRTSEASERSA